MQGIIPQISHQESRKCFRDALDSANYQNIQKGVMRDTTFLNYFFRNLLLGEENELRNRCMLVNTPEGLKKEKESDPTTTQQVPNNLRTSTPQIAELIRAINNQSMSAKEIMHRLGLKDRSNFLRSYLNPATQEDIIELLYPNSPNHPRQKYLLTVKGMAILNDMNND